MHPVRRCEVSTAPARRSCLLRPSSCSIWAPRFASWGHRKQHNIPVRPLKPSPSKCGPLNVRVRLNSERWLANAHDNELHPDSTTRLTCRSMQTEMPTRQSTTSRRPVIFKACGHADEKKLSEVCVQQCGLTRRRREEASWSLIPAQLASLYNFTCSEIVTLVPLARTHTVPLSVCSADQDHETICSQSCRRPSRTIYVVRSSGTSFTTAVLDTKSPAAHHSSVQPASPSPRSDLPRSLCHCRPRTLV